MVFSTFAFSARQSARGSRLAMGLVLGGFVLGAVPASADILFSLNTSQTTQTAPIAAQPYGGGAYGVNGHTAAPPASASPVAPPSISFLESPANLTASYSPPALSSQALRVSPPHSEIVAAVSGAPSYDPGDRAGPWGPSARAHAADVSAKVFELVNAERAKLGLAPLTASGGLARAAGSYAADMVEGDFFGHYDPNGRGFNERVHESGLGHYDELAENLFNSEGQVAWFATANARATIKGWMESRQGHREAMLDPKLSEAGVGAAMREGRYVVSMVFGRP